MRKPGTVIQLGKRCATTTTIGVYTMPEHIVNDSVEISHKNCIAWNKSQFDISWCIQNGFVERRKISMNESYQFFSSTKTCRFRIQQFVLIWRHTAVQSSISNLFKQIDSCQQRLSCQTPVMNGMCTLQEAYWQDPLFV